MFKFENYKHEIAMVSDHKNVDLGIAYEMFKADVKAGKAHEYNTGNSLPNFDFAKAHAEYEALTDEEKANA